MQFFPKNYDFFELFSQQVVQLGAAVDLLHDLENGRDRREVARAMKDVEHAADRVTHEIFNRLNQTFITPIEREDIILLATATDDIIDTIDRTTNRIALYKIDPTTRTLTQYLHLIDKAVKEVSQALHELKKANKGYSNILKHCEIINFIENQVDEHNHQVLADLFENEKNPIELIKLKEIYEQLEDVADRCEDVANALEAIVIKNQ
ncbi:MAG: DUF47 family protein [Patescibacteria group bacterium]